MLGCLKVGGELVGEPRIPIVHGFNQQLKVKGIKKAVNKVNWLSHVC